MRLIALYGHSNCGKSNTLNWLKELLRAAGKSISSMPRPHSEQPETFDYKGLVVCVAPAGDNEDIIKSNILYFNAKKCDVAITASRCKGGTVNRLDAYAQSLGISVEWVPKSYEHILSSATQEHCNQETAQLIFSMI